MLVGGAVQLAVLFMSGDGFGSDGPPVTHELLAGADLFDLITGKAQYRHRRLAAGGDRPPVGGDNHGEWRFFVAGLGVGAGALLAGTGAAIVQSALVPITIPDSDDPFASGESGKEMIAALLLCVVLGALALATLPVALALIWATDTGGAALVTVYGALTIAIGWVLIQVGIKIATRACAAASRSSSPPSRRHDQRRACASAAARLAAAEAASVGNALDAARAKLLTGSALTAGRRRRSPAAAPAAARRGRPRTASPRPPGRPAGRSPRRPATGIAALTDREREVAALVATGDRTAGSPPSSTCPRRPWKHTSPTFSGNSGCGSVRRSRRCWQRVESRHGPASTIIPFVPGRRPTDEARHPWLGSSDQIAFVNAGEGNRCYLLLKVAGRPASWSSTGR